MDVAKGVYVWDVRLQLIVDFDVAFGTNLHSRRLKVESVGVWLSTSGKEEMRAADSHVVTLFILVEDEEFVFVSPTLVWLDVRYFSLQKNLHTVLCHDLCHCFCDFRIFARYDLLPSLDDGYSSSQPLKQLSEFQSNIATTEDNEMMGNLSQLHHRRRIQYPALIQRIQPRQIRPQRSFSCVDENRLCLQIYLFSANSVNGKRVLIFKASVTQNHLQTFLAIDSPLASAAEGVNDISFALPHFLHIHRYVNFLPTTIFLRMVSFMTLLQVRRGYVPDPVVLAAAREISDTAGGDHCLRWRAS